MDEVRTKGGRWTEEETLLALYLYFQLPFGRLHSGNPDIRQLAAAIGRSAGAVAMKLCNFASLDPAIIASGRRGLSGASKLDRRLYGEFGGDWTGLVERSERLWDARIAPPPAAAGPGGLAERRIDYVPDKYAAASTVEAVTKQRLGQGFFRRAVLANYEEACCVTGIAEPQLLVASHIKPWSVDVANRHNPANGFPLSATWDKAFDRGLVTIGSDRCIRLSTYLKRHKDRPTRDYFAPFDRAALRPAVRFDPEPALLEWHQRHRFVDNAQDRTAN